MWEVEAKGGFNEVVSVAKHVSVAFVLYPVITQPYGVKKHSLKCDFIKKTTLQL